MINIFHKFLENNINLSDFEEIIYKNTQLENEIGEANYQYFLELNYKNKYAKTEIQDFILNHIVSKNEFALWRLNRILDSNDIYFPDENLYEYAKQNPEFLNGKITEFKQFLSDKLIEIEWTNKVSQFVRHQSELIKDNEKYLHLGTYENSYIHLLVNQKDEIYIGYDVINKEKFFANNIKEAITKLILNTN